MRLIRSILTFSLTVLLAALTWGAIEGALLIRSARRTVEAVPAAVSGELLETRKLLACQLTALRAQTLARVDRLTDKADAQLTALRTDALVRVDQLTGRADAQLSTLNATATALQQQTTATIGAVQLDLGSFEDAATAVLVTTNKTVSDLHPQLLGLVAAAKVTAGETAQTMREVKTAAPEMVKSVQGIAASADGIAADAKLEADEITRPKRWWQKILGPVYTVIRCISLFL